jgi:hypothetical protein
MFHPTPCTAKFTRPFAASRQRGTWRSNHGLSKAMPMFPRILFGLLVGLAYLGGPMQALAGDFTASLSDAQQAAAGLTTLTADERAVLDRLVAAELIPGREIYSALNASFVLRQTAEARQLAGLDRLSPEQLDQLNSYVATALFPRPRPKERPRIKEGEVLAPQTTGEVHGAITVGLGWGGGGPTRYGSLELAYVDPELGFSLGIGMYSYSGPGHFGYYPHNAYPGFAGAAAGNFPATGRPVWTSDGYSGRNGIPPRPSIRQYFEPAPVPGVK